MNSEQFPAPRRGANRSPALSFINLTLLLTCTLAFAVATARMTGFDVKLRVPMIDGSTAKTVIQIAEGETAYWNGEPVLRSNLPARLSNLAKDPHDSGIIIAGSDTARMGDVVALIAEVEKAGLQFTLETNYRPEGR